MNIPLNIYDTLPRGCWVTIDVAQLAENVRRLKAFVDRPVLVAVKGNGYGHGLENAAKAFLKGGASYLGVANYAEGYVLRHCGITAPILVLNGIEPSEMVLAAQAGLDFFVFRPDHVAALREMPKSSSPIRAHIKVDTGMGRLGCFPSEVAALGTALQSIQGVTIAGLATHFAMASLPDNEHTKGQINQFEQAMASLANVGIRPEIIHAANSSGSLYHPHARYDMVRMGVVAYGVPPSAFPGLSIPEGVKTALTWHARISSSKILPAHSKVSYGCEYEMPREARMGILPVGYADGYHRIPKEINTVLIEGQERPARGRINMDQCIIDLEGMPDMTGTEVMILGKQGEKEISVQTLSKRWETNTYGVYVGIAQRVPRRVVGA